MNYLMFITIAHRIQQPIPKLRIWMTRIGWTVQLEQSKQVLLVLFVYYLFTICYFFCPKNQIWLVMTFVVSKLDVGSGEHDKFVCLTWWAGEEYFFTSSTSSLSIVGGFQILASFSSLKTIFLSKSIAIVPKRKCNYLSDLHLKKYSQKRRFQTYVYHWLVQHSWVSNHSAQKKDFYGGAGFKISCSYLLKVST